MASNKDVFKAVIEGKQRELAIKRPDRKIGTQAQVEYNKAFSAAVKSGALFREKLEQEARAQGVWSDDQEKKYQELIKKVNETDMRIKKGGFPLSEARDLAIDMRKLRGDMREMLSGRTQLDVNSAEGQAENARFNALVALCLVYNDTGKPVFATLDDYLSHSTEDYAFEAASRLGAMMYGLDSDYEANLPENKFLAEWNFVDDKLRLIDKNGHLVAVSGKLIDEEGRYIDEQGNFVDVDGNPMDEEGEYQIEQQPFLDDDGNPIVKDKPAEEEKPEDEGQPESK